MFGLIYKDLYLQWKKLLIMFFSVLLCSSISIFAPSEEIESAILLTALYNIISFFLIGMLHQGFFTDDETKCWSSFIASTPKSVKAQIGSKYILTLLTTVFLSLFIQIFNYFHFKPYDNDVDILVITIFCASIQIILRSFEYPFIIRFGSKYGNTIRTALNLTLFLIIVAYLLFGNISIFESYENELDWIITTIKKLSINSNFNNVKFLLPYAALIIYFISYKISTCLYLKAQDYYEK